MRDPRGKYSAYPAVSLPDRRWPGRVLERAPIWCSVDLRDGNQALPLPMGPARKRRFFAALLEMGFREIEVGYPSASALEHEFIREILEEGRVPDDVTIQVLTPALPERIAPTFESIAGARRAIVHLYHSTSELQRRLVFGLDRAGTIALAVRAATEIRERAERQRETEIVYQYSPESFTGTELDFALEICEAVLDVYEPTPEHPVILNLPATVEMATPNVFADQIEWFGRRLRRRDCVVLSVHPHNDRGCAVAAAELALLAGADRVEGTLFGNGERTGNVDLVTLALNLYSQGIDPGLDLRDIDARVRTAEHCNRIAVHARHPYAGSLVYTAFSGTHQDAIRKGFAARERAGGARWEVPYLPLDPADVGRGYEEVVRINSQSGKGGIAFVLERDHGLELPRAFQIELRDAVQELADRSERELGSKEIRDVFAAEYLEPRGPFALLAQHVIAQGASADGAPLRMAFRVRAGDRELDIEGAGVGPLDAFASALAGGCAQRVEITDYREHAIGGSADGTRARAAAYVSLRTAQGAIAHGAGIHESIVTAALEAVVSALNRAHAATPAFSAAAALARKGGDGL